MLKTSSNLAEVLQTLGRVQAMGADLSPLMRILRGMLHDSVEENFEQQGRPRWTALAPATIKRRTKEGTWPGKILQRRGRLAGSIEPGSDQSSAWVSTNLPYARIHQDGGEIHRASFSSWARLRTDRKGALARQEGSPNLAVFASKRHKTATSRKFTVGEHTIKIPARPFFDAPPEDQERYLSAGQRFILGLVK